MIVSQTSASLVCTRDPIGFEADHTAIVKPRNLKDEIHEWLRLEIQQENQ